MEPVRLLVSWSRIEPEPGRYDDAYIAEVRAAVRLLARHGIWSIIDLHQDAWGPTLAAPPGEAVPPGQEPAFGWDGAPGWATLDEGAPRCTIAGIRELSPAVRGAFAAFWPTGPGRAVWVCGRATPRCSVMSLSASPTSRQWPATTS